MKLNAKEPDKHCGRCGAPRASQEDRYCRDCGGQFDIVASTSSPLPQRADTAVSEGSHIESQARPTTNRPSLEWRAPTQEEEIQYGWRGLTLVMVAMDRHKLVLGVYRGARFITGTEPVGRTFTNHRLDVSWRPNIKFSGNIWSTIEEAQNAVSEALVLEPRRELPLSAGRRKVIEEDIEEDIDAPQRWLFRPPFWWTIGIWSFVQVLYQYSVYGSQPEVFVFRFLMGVPISFGILVVVFLIVDLLRKVRNLWEGYLPYLIILLIISVSVLWWLWGK